MRIGTACGPSGPAGAGGSNELALMSGLSLFMHPTGGNLGQNLAGGDLTVKGNPALSDPGPSADVPSVDLDGTGDWLTGTIDAEPFSSVSGSFWAAIAFNLDTTGNHCLLSTGGDGSSQAGWRMLWNQGASPTLGMTLSDGSNWGITNGLTMHPAARRGTGEWNILIVEYRHQAQDANTSLVRTTLNGMGDWTTATGERTMSISSLVFPLTPAFGAIVGNNDPNVNDLQANGRIIVAAGSGELTNEERWMFFAHERFRTHADVAARPAADPVKWCEAVHPTHNAVSYVFRSDQTLRVRIYDDSSGDRGSLVDTDAAVTPDVYGYVTGTFTGLTSDAKFHIVADVGGIDSIHECRCWTFPTGNTTFSINVVQDLSTQSGLNATNLNPMYSITEPATEPRGRIFNGDEGYWDIEDSDPVVHRDAVDAHLAGGGMTTGGGAARGQLALWYLYQLTAKLAATVSDHDGPGPDGDSTSDSQGAWQTIFRARHPGVTFPHAQSVYYRHDLSPELTLIAIDTRSEAVYASDVLINSTQLAQLETWLSAIASEDRFGLLLSERIWEGGEPSTEFWNEDTTNRQAIFDHIQSVSGLDDALLSLIGDVHMQAADDGSNQGNFDAGGLARVRCISAGKQLHSTTSSKGTWSQFSQTSGNGAFCNLEIVDHNTATPDLTARLYELATVDHAYAFTLTKA